jgi:hypothetical protein
MGISLPFRSKNGWSELRLESRTLKSTGRFPGFCCTINKIEIVNQARELNG